MSITINVPDENIDAPVYLPDNGETEDRDAYVDVRLASGAAADNGI